MASYYHGRALRRQALAIRSGVSNPNSQHYDDPDAEKRAQELEELAERADDDAHDRALEMRLDREAGDL